MGHIRTELVVLAGENGIEDNTSDGSNGQAGKGHMGLADGEGEAAGEAQAAHQNDGRNDEVTAVSEIHPVFHNVAHTDGGDHAVEDEADTADDGRRDGVDHHGKSGREGQHNGIHRCQTDHTGIIDPAENQNAGVLTIGGIGGAAEKGGERGCDTIADKGAVEARILNEVLAHSGRDGGHISDMLHHGGNGNRRHNQNAGEVKLGNRTGEVGDERLEAQQAHALQSAEVQHGAGSAGSSVCDNGCAKGVGNNRHNIRAHHAQKNGDNFDHAFAPDVGRHNDGHGHHCQPPAGGSVVYCGGSQVQADEDDNGACYHRRQEAHDLLHAHRLNNSGQDHIEEARHHDAAHSVLELFSRLHGGILAGAHFCHGLETAQECKGGTQERGNLHLGADVEKQGTETGKEQRCLDIQRQTIALDQNRDQHRGAKHGKHMLQPQNHHLGHAQLPRVINGGVLLMVHDFLPLFHTHCTLSVA